MLVGNFSLTPTMLLAMLFSIGLIGLIGYALIAKPRLPSAEPARVSSFRTAGVLFFVGGTTLFCYQWLILFVFWPFSSLLAFFPHNFTAQLIVSGLLVAFSAAVWEELIYRGAFLWLAQKCGLARGAVLALILVQAVLFAWAHVGTGWHVRLPYSVSLLCGGIFLACTARVFSGLWFAMGAHLGWNWATHVIGGIEHHPLPFQQGTFGTAGTAHNEFEALCLALLAFVTIFWWWRWEGLRASRRA